MIRLKQVLILMVLVAIQPVFCMQQPNEAAQMPEYRRVGARPIADIAVPRLLQEGYFQGASELMNQGVVLSKSTRELLADPKIAKSVFQAALQEGHLTTLNRLVHYKLITADQAQHAFEDCMRFLIYTEKQKQLLLLLQSNVRFLIDLNKPILPSEFARAFTQDPALFIVLALPIIEQNRGNTLNLMNALLKAGANPNIKEADGMPLLHVLIRSISLLFLKDPKSDLHTFYLGLFFMLINLPGIDLEIRDSQGLTPLIFASELGIQSAVELLLLVGADVNAQDNEQFTALMHALHLANPEPIATMLINHGADLLLTDEDGLNVLEQAHEINLPESLIHLIEQKTAEQLEAQKERTKIINQEDAFGAWEN